MVNVFLKQHDHAITEVLVNNHAGYADSGQDLVCAGVSSILIGMMNALDELSPESCAFEMKKAHVRILVNKVTSDNQLLLKGLKIQLLTLEETYTNYITIKDQEV